MQLASIASHESDDEDDGSPGSLERLPSWLERARIHDSPPSTAAADEGGHGVGGSGFTMPQAFLATVKAAVGPAVLYMPKGFQEGGLGFSLGMLMLSYFLFALGATRLLECWKMAESRNRKTSYAGMMGKAFGPHGTALVRFTIVAQQCGICLTYFIFVATNLDELINYAGFGQTSLALLCVVQVAVYAPLCCIRDVQSFAHTNLIANALILYSLVVLGAHAGTRVVRSADVVSLPFFNSQSFYLFIGTSAFVYEGSAALVIPLQEAVHPETQDEFPRMYVRTCGGIAATYICFGVLNWAAYGDGTETVLTVNLPAGRWKASVQLAYSIAVMCTFPLQLFPAIQILKSQVSKVRKRVVSFCASRRTYSAVPEPEHVVSLNNEASKPKRKPPRMLGDLGRAALVAALSGLSILEVHSLDKLVALLGGLLGIPLAFVYPLLMHLKLVPDASPTSKTLNRVFACVGAVLGIACTGVTIATW